MYKIIIVAKFIINNIFIKFAILVILGKYK